MQPEIEDFFAAYGAEVARAEAALQRGQPPSIVRAGETLCLRFDGHQWRTTVIGAAYRHLMAASHVTASMALRFEPGAPLPDGTRHAVAALLAADGPEPAAIELLERCRMVLDGGPYDRWQTIGDAIEPLTHRCIQRAAEVELEALHAATGAFLAHCGEQRDAVVFVVCGGHQPRYRQLAKQYFAARLGQGSEGIRHARRVVYAENASEAEALRLVALQRVDRRIAGRIWGDAQRLQEDVLGEAAAEALAALGLGG